MMVKALMVATQSPVLDVLNLFNMQHASSSVLLRPIVCLPFPIRRYAWQ